MKNLFKLSLLVGCFAFIASTTYGQTIFNNTPCEITVSYRYSPSTPPCAAISGGGSVTIAAGGSQLVLPLGTVFTSARGGHTASLPTCGFNIGQLVLLFHKLKLSIVHYLLA